MRYLKWLNSLNPLYWIRKTKEDIFNEVRDYSNSLERIPTLAEVSEEVINRTRKISRHNTLNYLLSALSIPIVVGLAVSLLERKLTSSDSGIPGVLAFWGSVLFLMKQFKEYGRKLNREIGEEYGEEVRESFFRFGNYKDKESLRNFIFNLKMSEKD